MGKKVFKDINFGRNLDIDNIKAQDRTLEAIKTTEENPTKDNLIRTVEIINEDNILNQENKRELIIQLEKEFTYLFNLDSCPEGYIELKEEAKFLSKLSQYSFLLLAQRLKKIRDKELYKGDNYSDFKGFIEGELSISRGTVYKYIDIITYFGVSPGRHDIDYTKLVPYIPLLKSNNEGIPKEEVKNLCLQNIYIKSKKELEKEARELKERYGITNKKRDRNKYIKLLSYIREEINGPIEWEDKEVIRDMIKHLESIIG